MQKKNLKGNVLLLFAAAIWGFAFVAQRVGVTHIGSYTFTALRFALGALSLLPVIFITSKKAENPQKNNFSKKEELKSVIKSGTIAGIVLFSAVILQQVGLEDTTAGKAAFITGFYIILVPAFGVFFKQRVNAKTWVASILAILGMYFLSVNENFYIAKGDLLVFGCSFFFAAHILLINKYTRYVDTLKMSFVQYIVCSAISFLCAVAFEDINILNIQKAAVPILYGGFFSVGVAYTLQAYGQKYAKASHAAIIMSLESVFAVIGGALLLKESMSLRGYLGCLFMLAGVIVSQYVGKSGEISKTGTDLAN